MAPTTPASGSNLISVYLDRVEEFVTATGDPHYRSVPVARTLQIPLFQFIRSYHRNPSGPGRRALHLDRGKDLLRIPLWLTRTWTTGSLSRLPPPLETDSIPGTAVPRVRNRVLFLVQTVSKSGVDTLSEVWRHIPEDERAVVANRANRQQMLQQGIDAIDFESLADVRLAARYAPVVLRLLRGLRRTTNSDFRVPGIMPWLISQAFLVLHRIDVLARLLDLQPAAIVTADDTKPEGRILTELASGKSIPTFVVQHAFAAGDWNMSRLPVSSDYSFVNGPSDVDWFVERGVHKERLKPFGQPRFDQLIQGHRADRRDLCDALGIPPESSYFVLATNPVEEWKIRRQVDACLKAKRRARFPCTLVIRQHPAERPEELQRWLKGEDGVVVDRGGSAVELGDLLRHAMATVVYHSNVALEGMLCGSPILVPDLWEEDNPAPYAGTSAVRSFQSGHQLVELLAQLRGDPDFVKQLRSATRQHLEKRLGGLDGDAGIRIARFILEHRNVHD